MSEHTSPASDTSPLATAAVAALTASAPVQWLKDFTKGWRKGAALKSLPKLGQYLIRERTFDRERLLMRVVGIETTAKGFAADHFRCVYVDAVTGQPAEGARVQVRAYSAADRLGSGEWYTARPNKPLAKSPKSKAAKSSGPTEHEHEIGETDGADGEGAPQAG